MYCTKCGFENPDDSKFCASCGMAFVKENNEQMVDSTKIHMIHEIMDENLTKKRAEKKIGIHCPQCKSEKILVLPQTDIKGGYRIGRGCLGYLLLGPLGFLCGALGKKSKISAVNSTVFVCQECGFKFLNIEDTVAMTKKDRTETLILGIIGGIATLIAFQDGEILVSLVGLMIAIGAFLEYTSQKNLLDALEKDGFDAIGYPKIIENEK